MNAVKIALMALLMITTPVVQGQDKPDCLITAMETNARLTKVTPYHMIVSMKIWDRQLSMTVIGHAVCVFKLSHDGPVFLYDDKAGSVRLPTTAWDIYEIQDSINETVDGKVIVYDIAIVR